MILRISAGMLVNVGADIAMVSKLEERVFEAPGSQETLIR